MVKIVEANDRRGLKRFVRLAFRLYRDDPLFSPELIRDQLEHLSEKNPFVRQAKVRYFIATDGREDLGRIAAIVNPMHNEFHNDRTGFFGFFECINDQEVASALLDRASEVLKEEGMETLRGPMNFSTNEFCGVLIKGFDLPPTIMTPYNPPYYRELLESAGLQKAKDLHAYTRDIPRQLPEKVLRVARMAENRGITVRKVNTKQLYEELRAFNEIYYDAWKDNWGFVPFTDEELRYVAKKLKVAIVPDLMLIAEHKGEPVGFLGLIPDLSLVLRKMKGRLTPLSILKAIYWSRKIDRLRLLLLGIKKDYRFRGVDALLFREGFKGAKRYKEVEFSWILEDNLPVIRLVEMIGGRLSRVFRIYEKPV
jgi:hypothetical protein